HRWVALAVLAVAGSTIVGEQRSPGRHRLRADSRYRSTGQGLNIGSKRQEIGTRKHLVAAEGEHLRDAAFRMPAVDSDAQRLEHGFGVAAPQPGLVAQIWVAFAPRRIGAVADRA